MRAVFIGALLGIVPTARGDGSVTPEARPEFDAVVAAYRHLSSYENHGELSITATIDGKPTHRAWSFAFRSHRPDQFALDAGAVRLMSDGKTMLTVLVPTKRYWAEPAPKRLSVAALAEGPAGAMALGGPARSPALAILQLLLEDDPAKALLEGDFVVTRADDREQKGKKLHVLVFTPPTGPALRMFIDPDTHLVQRITLIGESKPPVGAAPDLEVAWDAGAISIEALAPERFAVVPPAGFQETSPLQAAEKKDEPKAPKAGADEPKE